MGLSPASSRSSGSSSGGGLTLLSRTLNGSTAAFDVASLAQTYDDLILVLVARTGNAVVAEHALIRFNNDAGSSYAYSYILNSSITQQAPTTAGQCAYVTGASGTANYFGSSEIVVHGYANTSRFKPWVNTSGGQSLAAQAFEVDAGLWISTAAINRVQVFPAGGGGFVAGSELRIYGR